MSKTGNGKGLLVFGIILAVGFGAVLMISQSLANDAGNWYTTQNQLLTNQQNQGLIGPEEFTDRDWELQMTRDWMLAQVFLVKPITTVGVYIGFLLIFIGLIVFASEGQIDEQMRRILITIAGVLLFVMLITFTGSLNLTIS